MILDRSHSPFLSLDIDIIRYNDTGPDALEFGVHLANFPEENATISGSSVAEPVGRYSAELGCVIGILPVDIN